MGRTWVAEWVTDRSHKGWVTDESQINHIWVSNGLQMGYI